MPSTEEQIAQLRSAISAQETLRPTLGDGVVEVTLKALRTQLDALLAEQKDGAQPKPGPSPEALLAQLPEVDLFLAPGAVPRVVEAVEAALAGRRGSSLFRRGGFLLADVLTIVRCGAPASPAKKRGQNNRRYYGYVFDIELHFQSSLFC